MADTTKKTIPKKSPEWNNSSKKAEEEPKANPRTAMEAGREAATETATEVEAATETATEVEAATETATEAATEAAMEGATEGATGTGVSLKITMRKESERDPQLFAQNFFPHHTRLQFGLMHRVIFTLYTRTLRPCPLEQRPARRLAIAAPRGAAKSTLKTLILPIHATLYARERYVVIVSATLKQAQQRLHNIQAEFRTNERLREVFQEELKRKGKWTGKSINLNGVQIEVYSAGTELRGISHRQWRPTLILLDDVENSAGARSIQRRDKLFEWYNEVIENLGDTYTAIEIVGTLLHPDSLLARLLKRPDFDARVFRSIERFADRADLWEQWRSLYSNLDDPDRLETARRFFAQRRAEMTRGTRVLWQAKEDYYELMCQLATRGRSAFFKEKQNEPGAAEDVFFDLSRAVKFRRSADNTTLQVLPLSGGSVGSAGFSPSHDLPTPICQTLPAPAPSISSAPLSSSFILPPSSFPTPLSSSFILAPSSFPTPSTSPTLPLQDLIIAGFLDAATGSGARKNTGDYAAIVTVGMDRAGYLYVLDVWLKRAAPTAQIAAMFDLHEKWRYTLFGIETNCFQQLLLLPIEEERKRRKALVSNAPTGHSVGSASASESVGSAGFSPSSATPIPTSHSVGSAGFSPSTPPVSSLPSTVSNLPSPASNLQTTDYRLQTPLWQLPIREVHHSRNKETRIATLEPLVTNGWLRFANDLPEMFWAQLESFPHGEHDDGPDALEAAISLLRSLQTQTRRGPKRESLRTLSNL